MKKKILVLGGTGMLGSMLVNYLSKNDNFELQYTIRNKKYNEMFENENYILFDAFEHNLDFLSGYDWVINAIGHIKQKMAPNPCDLSKIIFLNSFFPILLSEHANKNNYRIIQIATDCVFSGTRGQYDETDIHDAIDIYGKTKSIGELILENTIILRTSIVGPEKLYNLSLMGWFLSNRYGARVNGYSNHMWNGITTLHFSKICESIISNNISLNHIQHIVPKNQVSKYELLTLISKFYGREDIIIDPYVSKSSIDRTLSTIYQQDNINIWKKTGKCNPPTIEEMIKELAEYENK